MAVQIDHEYATPRHTTHLTQDLHHLLINKMMCEQRADHIVKLQIQERQRQCIATHTTDLSKPLRLPIDRLRGTLIQLEPDGPKPPLRLPRPSRRHAQQLSRTGTDVEHRKTLQLLRFNLAKQRGP